MGMVIGLVIFESIAPIKNAEGNKNVNFWGQISNFLLYDRFICLTPQNFTKGLIYAKFISHSSFSMVKGF